jgi:hypothetical protein
MISDFDVTRISSSAGSVFQGLKAPNLYSTSGDFGRSTWQISSSPVLLLAGVVSPTSCVIESVVHFPEMSFPRLTFMLCSGVPVMIPF